MSDDLDLDALEGSGRQALANKDMALLVNPQVFLDVIALARRTQEANALARESDATIEKLKTTVWRLMAERDAALARVADLERTLAWALDCFTEDDRRYQPWIDASALLSARSVPVPQEPKS